jgi:DNA-binding helix-turn-helix protein
MAKKGQSPYLPQIIERRSPMKIPRYGKLSARLRELGLSQTDLAYALRLSPGAISQRMQGNTAWNIEEMYRTMELCRISPEEMHIYFPDPATQRGRRSA